MTESPELRIAALEAELAALRAEMQEFTYTVSHDLRAPLRHILSYAQLVQEDAGPQLSADVQGFLSTISDSARHLGLQLDAMTALFRVGTVPLVLCPVSLSNLVQEVCAELSGQHPQRVLDWRIAGDLPVVRADVHLLRQALLHVLGNAVKFSAPREQTVINITSAQGADAHCASLQVRDNGVGYNPAMQARLFQLFGRLHSARQFAGLGMGLVLTRKILQRLGGAVTMVGVVDGGCCTTLTLRLD